MMNNSHQFFMQRAIALAQHSVEAGHGGPFGAVIVKDQVIIAEGFNQVTSCQDPTAHAEVVAIRQACQHLQTFQLTGCVLYSSCEPCPMCLGAIYWARLDAVYYALTRQDAAHIQFDDAFIYQQINTPLAQRSIPFMQLACDEAAAVFTAWRNSSNKIRY